MADPQLLENQGYVHNFARDIWFSRNAKKIFSREAIEDNDDAWLSARMAEPSTDWTFYFNERPNDLVKADILKELEPR